MRLFLALPVPDAWAAAADGTLAALPAPLRAELRPIPRAELHVTLRFLGELPASRLSVLEHALARLLPPVDVTIAPGPAALLGPSRRERVLALGATGAGLAELAVRAERAAIAAGLPPTDPPFAGHMTIARVPDGLSAGARRALAAAVSALPPPRAAHARVLAVELMESTGGEPGARYRTVARYG
ncbi:MAG: RNA 2',3'-cyclic phosphodiesterase [Dehalococcoidia bacterium]